MRLPPLLLPLGLLLAVWLPPIARGKFWAFDDGLIELFPQRRIVAWALAHGEFPFWNPYIFGGQPLFAGIQPGVLMPLNWPAGLCGLAAGEDLTTLLAYMVVITGMAAYARALALPPLAVGLAALAFPFAGFITHYNAFANILQAAGLTAWLLWALERHQATGRRGYLGAAAACAAGTIFAGHPQTAAYGLIMAGTYALALGGGWRALAARGAALALGLGLGAIQLLPTLDLIAASQRHQIGYEWLTSYSVLPTGLALQLFPGLFGALSPTPLYPTPYWAPMGYIGALEGYAGPVVWLLALVALGRRGAWRVRYWGAMALAGLVLSFGKYTPLYKLWALLPFVSQMPYASRHGFEATFALAMLAAYGLAWVLEEPAAARRWLDRVAGVMALAMGGFWLALMAYGPRFAARTQPFIDATPGAPTLDLARALAPWQPTFWLPLVLLTAAWAAGRWRPGLVLGVLALDLGLLNLAQGPYARLPAVPTDLALAPAIHWSAGRSLAVAPGRYPFEPGHDELALVRKLHYPCVSMLTGEPTVNGYDAFVPRRYGQLLGMDSFGKAGEFDPSIWEPAHHALDLLGLTTLRLDPRIAREPAWQTRLAGDRWQPLPAEGDLVVRRNTHAQPHAWRVASARVLTPAEVDEAVRGHRPFAPANEALLEAPAPTGPFALGPAYATSPSLNRMALDTDGAGPGLVLIGSGYDPGWRARAASGQELPVMRADALLLAVAVPPGRQHVELSYQPARWPMAAGSFLASLAALGAWMLWP